MTANARRIGLALALLLATPVAAEQVGEIGTDWTGNDIVIAQLHNDGRRASVYFDVRHANAIAAAILTLAKDFSGR